MLSADEVRQLIGSTAYASDGQKIGKVGQVYLDDSTGQPEWVTVNTGLFGTSESFVPLSRATWDGQALTLAHLKDTVKNAPNVGEDGHLSPQEEDVLYDYYRPGWETYDPAVEDTTTSTTGTVAATSGVETPAPVDDDAAMTRSEERLEVGTRSQEAGRARLRRWVDTEYVNVTVPVRREKAALEVESTTDPVTGEVTSRSDLIADEGREVVLSEERPVVTTASQPVERVRIGTETVTEEQTVTEEVRKERIDLETDVDVDHRTP
jgi:stress response protein YsnF